MTRVDTGTVSLGEFTFDCGETVPALDIAYEAYGTFEGENAVLVCHALTGSQNVAAIGDSENGTAGQARAWWDDIVGPGKAIDTNKYYVVCANVPGSCYGSSGPASTAPEGRASDEHGRWGTAFPPVTVSDWTRAQRHLLDALGVGRLHAVVGGSVGGMNALDWAVQYPDDVELIAPIAAAARLDPQCLALDAISRRAIRSDPHWQEGNYYDSEPPRDGLALARQLGHVMYLSKASMDRKFGRRSAGREHTGHEFPVDPAGEFFPYRDVESYLDYQAGAFVDRFDANSYLYLTRAMDEYDLASGYGSDAAALAAFEGEALVMSFSADWHFTVEQAETLATAFRESDTPVAHHAVDSDHGHDAFLVEPDKVGPPVSAFLTDGVDSRMIRDCTDREPELSAAPVHSSLFSG